MQYGNLKILLKSDYNEKTRLYCYGFKILLLAVCTTEMKDMVMEALKAEGFEAAKSDNFYYYMMKLDGTVPIGYYNLGKDMKISVYDFGSKENKNLALRILKNNVRAPVWLTLLLFR
jgi:hypothetical protein